LDIDDEDQRPIELIPTNPAKVVLEYILSNNQPKLRLEDEFFYDNVSMTSS